MISVIPPPTALTLGNSSVTTGNYACRKMGIMYDRSNAMVVRVNTALAAMGLARSKSREEY